LLSIIVLLGNCASLVKIGAARVLSGARRDLARAAGVIQPVRAPARREMRLTARGLTRARFAWRSLRVVALSVAGFFLVCIGLLLVFQRSLIYFPRGYEPSFRRGLPAGCVELPFRTSAGAQTAWYLPPRRKPAGAATRLWVMFSGNASRALDWLDFVESRALDEAAFLLVDYPGYGVCEGRPTREGIAESADGAWRALTERFTGPDSPAEWELGVVGLSIGSAVGLEFATRHPVRRMILLAPFTSLLDMARRSVGVPLCYLLYDRFDNRARLRELAARPDPPQVDLFHGTADEIVPFRMGEALARAHPQMIRLHPVKHATHNDILEFAHGGIVEAMRAAGSEPRGETGAQRSVIEN
jgi:pimeloyl-ACP methyl ester carboxylesterase